MRSWEAWPSCKHGDDDAFHSTTLDVYEVHSCGCPVAGEGKREGKARRVRGRAAVGERGLCQATRSRAVACTPGSARAPTKSSCDKGGLFCHYSYFYYRINSHA